MTGCKNPVDTVTVESILTEGVPQLPDLSDLSHAEKDALIRALWQRLEAAERRIAELEARLGEPSKTPDNSSLPPSKGQKPNKPETGKRIGPRQGSLGRKGGGRPLACDPDETDAVVALYAVSVLLGAIVYLYFKSDPRTGGDGHWQALALSH